MRTSSGRTGWALRNAAAPLPNPPRLLAASALFLVAGCGCKLDLAMGVSPQSKAIRVGESFTGSARFLGCGGTEVLRDVIRWRTDDTLVVRVDSLTGRITGRAPGSAAVSAYGERYGLAGTIAVQVNP